MLRSFPHYQQLDSMDCGPSCLRMIAKFYGRVYSIQNLREKAFITREGVSMLGISEAAEAIGFRTQGVRITVEELEKECPLPCILHWNQWHFVVCYKIRKGKFYIADPAAGLITYTREEFKRCWVSTNTRNQCRKEKLPIRGRIPGRRSCWNRGRSSTGWRTRGETGNVTSDSFSDIYRPTGGRWYSSCWAC